MSYYPYLDKVFIQSVFNQYQLPQSNGWKQNVNSQILQKYLEIKKINKNKLNHEQLLPYKIFPKQYGQINYYTDKYNLDRLKRIQNASNRKYQKNSRSQPHFNLRTSYERSPSLMKIQAQNQKINSRKIIRTSQQMIQNNSLKSLSQTNLTPSVISKITPAKKNTFNSNNLIQSDLENSLDVQNQYTPLKKQDKSLNNRKISNQKNKNNLLTFTGNKNQIRSTQSFFNIQKQQKNNNPNNQYNELLKSKNNNNIQLSKQSSRRSIQNYHSSKNIHIKKQNNIQQKLQQYYGEQFQRIKQQRDYLRKHFILHLQKKHPTQIPYKKVQKISTDDVNNKIIIKKYQIPHYQNDLQQSIQQVPRKYKY